MKKYLYLIVLFFTKSCFALLYILIFFGFFLLHSTNAFSQNTDKTVSAPENEWTLYTWIYPSFYTLHKKNETCFAVSFFLFFFVVYKIYTT